MHPVITDNLTDHAVKAQAVVDSQSARFQVSEFVLSGYRLFRNFAVLLASGLIDFPKELAQAVLTYSTADLRETFPEFYTLIDAETEIVDLDEAIDNGADFSDTLLSYVDGFPVVRLMKDGAVLHGGFMDGSVVKTDDEHYEEAEAEDLGGCACCDPEAGPAVFSKDTVEELEAALNARSMCRGDGSVSPAQQDYNRFMAKNLCGVAVSDEERAEFAALHTIVVEESAARIAATKAFEARRAAEIAAANDARCGQTAPSTAKVVDGMMVGLLQQLLDLEPDQLAALKEAKVVGVDYVAFGPAGGYFLNTADGARLRLAPPLAFTGFSDEQR